MRTFVNTVADRMLTLVAPQARAGACECQQTTWTEYRCQGGQNHQKRTCQTLCNCSTKCGAWVTIGDC